MIKMNIRCPQELLSDLNLAKTTSPFMWESHRKTQFSREVARRIIEPYVPARRKRKLMRQDNKYFGYHVQKKPTILVTNVSKCMFEGDELLNIVNETIEILKLATKSAAATVYIVDDLADEIFPLIGEKQFGELRISYKIETGTSVAAHVAATKQHVLINDLLADIRFPQGLKNFEVTVKAVICVPLLTPEGECSAVVELYRNYNEDNYTEADLRLVIVMCNWMGTAIYTLQLRETLQKQRELSEYLLDLTRIYFDDTKVLEVLISDVMNFAKNAINVEHGLFYILEKRDSDFYTEIWDEIDDKGEIFYEKQSCATPLSDCDEIIKTVLSKGTTLCIKNAFFDPRVVQPPNYVTTSVLCVPIKVMNEVLGAIKLINKKKVLSFSKWDEMILRTFCAHCGNVLSYYKLHRKMRHIMNTNKLYLDMLSIHMLPCVHDIYFVNYKRSFGEIQLPPKFHQFNYYVTDEYEVYMAPLIICMFMELFPNILDYDIMVKFVLTVRKTQFNKTYFNFEHTFFVVHVVYNILKKDLDMFTKVEKLALMIAALCHSIDDFGLSNSFMLLSNHFLYELYDEHTKQNHCYHVTVFILKFLKVLENIEEEEYEEFLKELQYCMFSTDLTLCIKRKIKMSALCATGKFDISNAEHRYLLKGMIMAIAYTNLYLKPYNKSKVIAESWYEEKKKETQLTAEKGLCPIIIPEKKHLIPNEQLRIIDTLILPCVVLIIKAIPTCHWLGRDVKRLRDAWQEALDSQGMKMWYIDESYPDKMRKCESRMRND